MLEDITNPYGFMRALTLVLRLRPGGLLFCGLPCNSFAYISAGTHQRDADNLWGNQDQPLVHLGNLIAARSTLLLMVALARCAVWALENPARSRVCLFPYLVTLLNAPVFIHRSVFWPGFAKVRGEGANNHRCIDLYIYCY